MFSFNLSGLPELGQMDLVECSGQWGITPRTPTEHLLEVIYKGSALYTINNQDYILNEGDMVFIPQKQQWQSQVYNCKSCQFFYVYFTINSQLTSLKDTEVNSCFNLANSILLKKKYYCPETPPVSTFSQIILPVTMPLGNHFNQIKFLIKQALEDRDNLVATSGLKIALNLSDVFTLITEQVSLNLQDKSILLCRPHVDQYVAQLVRFIKLNYNNKLTLVDMCNFVNVSQQYLIRLFCRELGQTPIQYLNYVRLSVAKDMILNTNLPLKEISYAVGVTNPFYFSRLFKKYEGVSPSDYRNMLSFRNHVS